MKNTPTHPVEKQIVIFDTNKPNTTLAEAQSQLDYLKLIYREELGWFTDYSAIFSLGPGKFRLFSRHTRFE